MHAANNNVKKLNWAILGDAGRDALYRCGNFWFRSLTLGRLALVAWLIAVLFGSRFGWGIREVGRRACVLRFAYFVHVVSIGGSILNCSCGAALDWLFAWIEMAECALDVYSHHSQGYFGVAEFAAKLPTLQGTMEDGAATNVMTAIQVRS